MFFPDNYMHRAYACYDIIDIKVTEWCLKYYNMKFINKLQALYLTI